MSLPTGARGRRMEARITRAAGKARLGPDGTALLVRAHRAAMAPREADEGALSSDHDPAYLHPGRTVLILLDDLEERVAGVLAVGALAESRDGALRAPRGAVEEVLEGTPGEPDGPDAIELWRSLPAPTWHDGDADADAALLEALVGVPPAVQRIALAEALDHIRHAHLWPSPAERRRALELAERVYGPIAPRVHPTLERRFGWWLTRVGPGLRSGAPDRQGR